MGVTKGQNSLDEIPTRRGGEARGVAGVKAQTVPGISLARTAVSVAPGGGTHPTPPLPTPSGEGGSHNLKSLKPDAFQGSPCGSLAASTWSTRSPLSLRTGTWLVLCFPPSVWS